MNTDDQRPGDLPPPAMVRDVPYGTAAYRTDWRYEPRASFKLREMPQSELLEWVERYLRRIRESGPDDISRANDCVEAMHFLNEIADRIYAGRETSEKLK